MPVNFANRMKFDNCTGCAILLANFPVPSQAPLRYLYPECSDRPFTNQISSSVRESATGGDIKVLAGVQAGSDELARLVAGSNCLRDSWALVQHG